MTSAASKLPVANQSIAKKQALGYNLSAPVFLLRSRQDKSLSGPRQGNVEYPHLLCQEHSFSLLFDNLVANRIQPDVGVGVDNPQSQQAIAVNETVAAKISAAERAVQLSEEHDAEFQALGLVNTHYADGIFALRLRPGPRPLLGRLRKLFDKCHKSAKRRYRCGTDKTLELNRPVMQFKQIGPPAASVGKCANIG